MLSAKDARQLMVNHQIEYKQEALDPNNKVNILIYNNIINYIKKSIKLNPYKYEINITNKYDILPSIVAKWLVRDGYIIKEYWVNSKKMTVISWCKEE